MHESSRRVRRVALCAAVSLVATAGLSAATRGPREAPAIPFTERYHAVRHGGLARAANASVTCRAPVGPAVPCALARRGHLGTNGQYEMTYTDVDRDPNTYNSSRAQLRIPRKSRVAYARLYWGGNLRVGEQKPAKDNRRVLLAEPRGRYRQVLADTLIGHRTTRYADAYQASADVTSLVRASGPGTYTVAQVNVAMGHSEAGAWGGWTLLVAYEDDSAPRRHLRIWDGFTALDDERTRYLEMRNMPFPATAAGSIGLVGYDGDPGSEEESLSLAGGDRAAVEIGDARNPLSDPFNSTITDGGREAPGRVPDHRNTFGYDSDVFDVRAALRGGGDRLGLRLASGDDTYLLGALFAQVDARR
ncbi:DUF3344 domain-containing protein [Streptomyces sp. MST-110588]|uniref:DUF3344 domain-containing protein n=1 Tax=Streptomyces sp. MST-110588 TaxID=2833628 RepID=UPI001F5CDC99|nr:DUF3344 domain-containing protein [Streptomyces sp. MST-110588]